MTTNKGTQSTYEIITNRIMEQLNQGNIPWIKPWQQVKEIGLPHNFITKKNYSGLNMFLLYSQNWSTPYFLTFKQVKQLKGNVKKGEKGTPIIYFAWLDKKGKKTDSDDSTSGKIPLLKYYTVFNADQCEGIDFPSIDDCKEQFNKTFEHIKSADDLLSHMSKRLFKGSFCVPKINYVQGNRAYYSKTSNEITMPLKEQFNSSPEFYSTLFHEIIHSTGHKDKLNRSTLIDAHFFGDNNYSKEELVAEMGAAFLCGLCDIDMHTLRNNSAYIKSWLRALKGNTQLIVQAASQAQKAVDMLVGDYRNDSNELKKAV